jgi:cyclophilin family peptidyl-prolyl cis-trans isomerase
LGLVESGIQRVKTESPPDAEVMAFLALVVESRFGIGDYDGAYAVSSALLGPAPESVGLLERQVFLAFATNRFEDCRTHLQQLVKVFGDVPAHLQTIAASLDAEIDAWKRETELRAAEAEANNLPRVELNLDLQGLPGRIELELFENEAPNTVANFISLVEQGFFDGRAFFRVAPLLDAASGSPQDDGTGNPGYLIRSEAQRTDARKHFRGSLAMIALEARGLEGSQFHLLYAPNPELDGRATVFGRVIGGMEWLDRLTRTHRQDETNGEFKPIPDVTPTTIESARVVRKRDHEYVPEKVFVREN